MTEDRVQRRLAAILQAWTAEWSDLVEFEIVPVAVGKDTAVALSGQS